MKTITFVLCWLLTSSVIADECTDNMNAYIQNLEGLISSELSGYEEKEIAKNKLHRVTAKRGIMTDCEIRAEILGFNKASSRKNNLPLPSVEVGK